jgi:hypothetical protein
VKADFWAPAFNLWTLPEFCYQMFVEPQPLSRGNPSRWVLAFAAAACAASLCALAWRARNGEWQILLTAVGPFALAAVASLLGTRTFCLRYFLFAHLFLLAAIAVLVWRIHSGTVRLAVAGTVLLASCSATLGFLNGLHLSEHQGARAAAEYIESHRASGERVVAASPLWSLPVAYHLGEPVGVYSPPGVTMPHYYGTAALVPTDAIDLTVLEKEAGSRMWVVGGRGGCWGRQEVPVPSGWVVRESHAFPEALRVGTALVFLYERLPAPNSGGAR